MKKFQKNCSLLPEVTEMLFGQIKPNLSAWLESTFSFLNLSFGCTDPILLFTAVCQPLRKESQFSSLRLLLQSEPSSPSPEADL